MEKRSSVQGGGPLHGDENLCFVRPLRGGGPLRGKEAPCVGGGPLCRAEALSVERRTSVP